MSKHTPGPWKLKREGVVSDMNGELIATLGYRVTPVNAGECCEDDCNALLVAAAPDLLAACKMVAAMAVPHEPLSVGDIAEVLAAIAKAEGRS